MAPTGPDETTAPRVPASGLGRAATRVQPWQAIVLAVALTLIVALGDLLTGPYLVFATFYLLPVAVAAWYVGRRAALLVSGLAAVVGVLSTAINPGDVPAAVFLLNGVFRFVTYAFVSVVVAAERSAIETISALATIDPLTQLRNRRSFYERGTDELTRCRRSGRPLALAVIDVDDLKLRNDTFGHEAGDAMLVEFADVARRVMRSGDLVARLGGDEFCLLLPESDLEAAQATLSRLAAALGEVEVLPIGVSVGLVAGVPDSEQSIESTVRAADQLMYEAKRSGKGRVVAAAMGCAAGPGLR